MKHAVKEKKRNGFIEIYNVETGVVVNKCRSTTMAAYLILKLEEGSK